MGLPLLLGQNLIFFANIGNVQPISFAITTVTHNVRHTDNAINIDTLSKNNIFRKLQIPRTIAHKIEILNSLNITLNMSFNSI